MNSISRRSSECSSRCAIHYGYRARTFPYSWGKEKLRPWSEFLGRENSDHGQSFGVFFRRTQEGCGGLGEENPAAFPQARPIFQQPFSSPESAQTLAGIAFRAAGKSVKNFPAVSKYAGKPFQQGISDSHSLLEFLGVFLG